ncbi:cytochrome P450 [Mycena maculata]|uniref:Cytochrome P450 n=1 Tax=Mycena maculata TaxID=230809 RepID=A0AAD7IMU2_9AGAR|nr:cytochrome P450 [Mycena maculata]
MVLTWVDLALAACALPLVFKLITRRSTPPPPPGPRRLPLLGNILDMPSEKEWIKFSEWGQTYGDISSVSVFGQQMTIINSAQVAMDILDKKSSIYSDRPVVPMGGELVGWKNTLALTPYGERFRNYRRLAHSVFGSRSSMAGFEPLEETETHRFLKRLVSTPDGLQDHIRKAAGAIILRISHGYQVQEGADPFVTLADIATEQFSLSSSPGGFLVNLIPPLRHLPSWFPGADFQKTAKAWAETLCQMVEQPFQFVKQEIAAGSAEKSLVSILLDGKTLSPNEEFDVKWLSASLYSGGADTTVAAIYAFFKAMVLYPDVQKKAQQEIDAVVGNDRLPGFSDKHQLPYITALALEVLRWHSVAPTGVPHRVTEDDVHEGWFLPKGSLVITNIWKMAHDPRVYSNPMVFEPDRFIAKDGKKPELDPRDLAFGFGRRICPGRDLADASIFITCVMTLAVFNISKHPDGGEINMEQTTGTISHPSTFKCLVQPRSKKALEIIQGDVRLDACTVA